MPAMTQMSSSCAVRLLKSVLPAVLAALTVALNNGLGYTNISPTPGRTLAPAPVPYANATRVLPLGDSITFGCGDQCDKTKDCMVGGGMAPCSNCAAGYRGPLWASLAAGDAGDPRAWTFVGTQSNGGFAAPLHEGHPGYTITQLHGIVPSWVPTRPDVVLLHAGTNDLGGYVKPVATAQDAAERMRVLLNNTFAALPRVHVVLASLIGATKHYGGSKHAEFNALLPMTQSRSPSPSRSPKAGAGKYPKSEPCHGFLLLSVNMC